MIFAVCWKTATLTSSALRTPVSAIPYAKISDVECCSTVE
jgi:hypothetical protein